jgi:hypothetical protein
MTTYTLLAVFVALNQSYPERENLSLQQCAGHAAMARPLAEELYQYIGEVKYLCVPEHSLARSATDEHGIGGEQ